MKKLFAIGLAMLLTMWSYAQNGNAPTLLAVTPSAAATELEGVWPRQAVGEATGG